MKKQEQWKPTKFSVKGDKLGIGTGTRFSSRLMIGLIARNYNRVLPQHAKGDLLDLGCGQVPLYGAYKDLASSVTCVDWGSSLHENIHLDHEMDLNQPLALEDESYDTVIMSDVLEHIARPSQLLSEVHRILKTGGKLIMNVPFYYFLHERPHDYYRYTRYALDHLCKEAGFEVLEISAIGGMLECFSDISSKGVYPIPFVGKWISYFIFKCSWIFNRTSLGQRIANKSSEAFPFGYFLIAQKTKDK